MRPSRLFSPFKNTYREGVNDTHRHDVWNISPCGQEGRWFPRPNKDKESTSTFGDFPIQSHHPVLGCFGFSGYASEPSSSSEINQYTSNVDECWGEFKSQLDSSLDFYNDPGSTALDAPLTTYVDDGIFDPQTYISQEFSFDGESSASAVHSSLCLSHDFDSSVTLSRQGTTILGLPLVQDPQSVDVKIPQVKPELTDPGHLCHPSLPSTMNQNTVASYGGTYSLDSLGDQYQHEYSMIQKPTGHFQVAASYDTPAASAVGQNPFDSYSPSARQQAPPFPNIASTQVVSREHSLPKDSPPRLCGWQNDDGTICHEMITKVTLPEHLACHGIKNKSRDCPTRCQWAGCKRGRPMNRESIVRHIREVHMRLKRSPSSTSVRRPYSN